jgi:DNA polymerase-3 subunit epsilon
MATHDRLAFVDVETTGLSPADHRVAEIGVITVDGDRVERWTTFLKAGDPHSPAPAFHDIAPALAQRLAGRLFIAHNARFDYAFVRGELERAGIAFEAPVVCSVMLSRRLRPRLAHHDLDSLAAHHGLRVEERHRALPDAELVRQWWSGLRDDFDDATIAEAVDALLAGPVLPAALDPALIDSLPSAPGAFVMHGEDGRALMIGAAKNLRAHAIDYFRVDRATTRAAEHAHRVTNITFRRTRGMLGARLHAAWLMRVHGPRRVVPDVSWRFTPDATPCIDIVALEACRAPEYTESFGLFASERKARNALERLATRRALCCAMLGLSVDACAGCEHAGCGSALARKRHLLRVQAAIRPLRVDAWPYAGSIGIRERGDLHVIDGWQFLGTARSEAEAHELADTRGAGFDKRIYEILRRELPRTPRAKLVDLSAGTRAAEIRRGAAAASPRS